MISLIKSENLWTQNKILTEVGSLHSEDTVEQEGSLPLLVPIKVSVKDKGWDAVIDEDLVNSFLQYIQNVISPYLDLDNFTENESSYDTSKLYSLFFTNHYSNVTTMSSLGGSISGSISGSMIDNSSNLDESLKMSRTQSVAESVISEHSSVSNDTVKHSKEHKEHKSK